LKITFGILKAKHKGARNDSYRPALKAREKIKDFQFNGVKNLVPKKYKATQRRHCLFDKFHRYSNSRQQNSLDLCKRYFYARDKAQIYSR